MHIGVITYQRSHLKTLQLVTKLLVREYKITLYTFPFRHRPAKAKKSLDLGFADRPPQLVDFDLEAFCRRYKIGIVEVPGWEDGCDRLLDEGKPDVYLTCIAKIIPKTFIEGRIILNAHPGMLPYNRGVDAFKWSILNDWPVGVTLHVINEHIDHGTILRACKVPIFENDTLRQVADRSYEVEIDLLANFEQYLHSVDSGEKVSDDYPLSRRQISTAHDTELEQIFNRKRNTFIEKSQY